MIGYKLVTQEKTSHWDISVVWGENVTHEIEDKQTGPPLCSEYWIHFYSNPIIALIMNPRHANIKYPLMYLVEAEEPIKDDGLKLGTKKLTTLYRFPTYIPNFTEKAKLNILLECFTYSMNIDSIEEFKDSYKDKSFKDSYLFDSFDYSYSIGLRDGWLYTTARSNSWTNSDWYTFPFWSILEGISCDIKDHTYFDAMIERATKDE